MKENELAIGDWVCAAGTVLNGEERLMPPMRVVAIGETWVQLLIDPEAGDPDEYDIYEVRPIPLTVDALLANGWEWVHPKRLRAEVRDEEEQLVWAFEVTIFNDCRLCDKVWISGYSLRIPVEYVNELQHAMRLSGIEKEFEL